MKLYYLSIFRYKYRPNKTATTTTEAASSTSPTSTSTLALETTPSTTTTTSTTTTEQPVTEPEPLDHVQEVYEEDSEIDNTARESEISNNEEIFNDEVQTETNTPTQELIKSRGDRILDPTTGMEVTQESNFPWAWARNIMLEKPVLKKSASV